MSQSSDRPEAPIGFLMELAMRPKAMARYGGMSAREQQEVIRRARRVRSKAEMAELADSLVP